MLKGNVFTSVCQEFCPWGGGVHPQADTPLGRHPPDRHPRADTPQANTPLGRHNPGRHPPLQAYIPRQTPPRKMATAVVVRILLECILFSYPNTKFWNNYNYHVSFIISSKNENFNVNSPSNIHGIIQHETPELSRTWILEMYSVLA